MLKITNKSPFHPIPLSKSGNACVWPQIYKYLWCVFICIVQVCISPCPFFLLSFVGLLPSCLSAHHRKSAKWQYKGWSGLLIGPGLLHLSFSLPCTTIEAPKYWAVEVEVRLCGITLHSEAAFRQVWSHVCHSDWDHLKFGRLLSMFRDQPPI